MKTIWVGAGRGTGESHLRYGNMRARKLTSSMIDRILFDDDAETLSIWFRQSGRYICHGVPRAIYDALVCAKSAGTYFNDGIKGRYRCEGDPARRRYRPAG